MGDVLHFPSFMRRRDGKVEFHKRHAMALIKEGKRVLIARLSGSFIVQQIQEGRFEIQRYEKNGEPIGEPEIATEAALWKMIK